MFAIKNRLKHFVVTLRFSILSIFLTLFIITVLLLIGFVTVRFEKLLEYTSFSLMNHVSTSVLENVSTEMEPVKVQSKFTAELIEHNVFDPDKENQIVNYTFEVLKILPIVQGALWGDEEGDFVLAYKDANGTITTEIYNRRMNPFTHEIHKRNSDGKIIQRLQSKDFKFDPRERPWYINAKKIHDTIWTDVFRFQVNPALAFTAATPVYKPDGTLRGIFGLSIRLDDLVNFVTQQQVSLNGFAFIVTKEGKLIVYPRGKFSPNNSNKNAFLFDIHAVAKPWIAKSLDKYNQTEKEEFILKEDNKNYLFTYKPIPTLANLGWLIGVVVPEADFTNKLEDINLITIIDCLIIFLLGLLIVSKFVDKIVYPIKILVREANKIKHFDLSGSLDVKSRIKEVINLTDAFQALKQGLRSFQKYVPKTLVNQLIETQEDIRVGGVRKELGVFFSDVKDFTTIAENMEPNQLMVYMCEYFEEMAKIIMETRGTIDKYIGDSIMAFWGAPLIEDFPAQQSALAALHCQRKLGLLNKQWQSQGLPPLITRIGLHVGDAIVGNIGSTERLNYTALGDAINIASRLEKLNKLYSTEIIVSDMMYNKLQNQFVLRMLDRVTVRGKLVSMDIFELMAEHKNELTFDIDLYKKYYSEGFNHYKNQRWDEAIKLFYTCLEVYPEDTLALIFIKRCMNFQKNPPPSDWLGILKITE